MLFSLGHGKRILQPSDGGTESSLMPGGAVKLSSMAPNSETAMVEMGVSGDSNRSFGYYFPNADGVTGDDTNIIDALKALATAMADPAGDPPVDDSAIAPIFTYLGQFIDHDITANTDREALTVHITEPALPPRERDFVVDNISNLRNGSLRLDSLYGEGPMPSEFTEKVRNALRDSSDRAKMRLGGLADSIGDVIPLPNDGLADLPRLGDVVDDPNSGLSLDDINSLPDGDFKQSFFNSDNTLKKARAVIGDGRNDENLLVAQLHVAFLRFHNVIADELVATVPDVDERFDRARQITTWIYQWLVVNIYLPKICQNNVVEAVKNAGAPLYRDFQARVASSSPAPNTPLPLPLEFSVAAFRFGHSMVRDAYDYNSNFGRPGTLTPEATFRQLFSFTGGDNLGEEILQSRSDQLPSNWVIDWSRFANDTPLEPDHRARKIDIKLSPTLFDMFNESTAGGELQRILRNLAERNLRRSHLLNIPTGQACVASINAFDSSSGASVESNAHQVDWKDGYKNNVDLPDPDSQEELVVLPESVLGEAAAGQALTDGNMLDATPLWFYCLREAEVTEGDTLGPLGSRLVAETLIGLIVADPESYWHQDGGAGTWTPDSSPVGGSTISDLPAMLRSAGLMS